jgi:hypothetical protein
VFFPFPFVWLVLGMVDAETKVPRYARDDKFYPVDDKSILWMTNLSF